MYMDALHAAYGSLVAYFFVDVASCVLNQKHSLFPSRTMAGLIFSNGGS